MKTSAFFAVQAIMATTMVLAQEEIANVMIYNIDDCGRNPNNPNVVSAELVFFKDAGEIKVVDGKPQGTCMYGKLPTAGWPDTGSDADVYIDQDTIPSGCEAVFYTKTSDSQAEKEGQCLSFYRRVPSDGKCAVLSLPPFFGSAICCSPEACEVPTGDLPTNKPSKREALDVTAVKRAPLIDRSVEIGRSVERRAECKFNPNSDDGTQIFMGEQRRVTEEVECLSSEACTIETTLSFSQSITNSWGMSAEVGGPLFKVLTASISFSHEFSEEDTKAKDFTYSFQADAESRGYLTFQPRMECSPEGTLTGDCDKDWKKDINGQACFPVYNGGRPDGRYTYVRID